VTPRASRLAAGLAALATLAIAGCGGEARTTPAPAARSAPAPKFPLSSAEAAKRAKRIAVVVSDGSRVVDGGRGTPFTRTRFEVQRVLKGRLPHRFVVQVIGGRLGNRIVTSPVQPFARSHRYLLYLGPDGPAGPTIFPDNVIEVHR
jgi:hypothetical protein